MKLYRPRSVVSGYYSVLFALPRWRLLASVILVLLSAVILALGWEALPCLIYFGVSLSILWLYSRLSPGSVLWKPKRIVGLALTLLVYVILVGAATRSWPIAFASSSALAAIVVAGLDGTSLKRYALPLALGFVPLALHQAAARALSLASLFSSLLASAAVVAVDYLVYKFIGRRRVQGFNAADLGTLFLRHWLDKDKKIEEVFEALGAPRLVRPRVIFGDAVALVYTDVHFGPFSSVGSSRLPEIIERELGKSDHVLVLHGFGSHERDVASSDHVKLLAGALREAIGMGSPLLYHGAFRVGPIDGWVVKGLVFDRASLLFVSRPSRGIDDLPYSIYLKFEAAARARGLGDLVLVESHNWEAAGRLTPEDVSGLMEALSASLDVIEELKKRPPVEPVVKSLAVQAESPGLIGGEVKLVEIKGADGRDPFLLIYMRGNNMAPGAMESIANVAKEFRGLVEVVTNDEHTETGVRAHITYLPVHATPGLLKAVERGVRGLSEVQPTRGLSYASTGVVVKLLNNAAYELVYLLKKTYPEAAAALIAYVTFAPLIAAGAFGLATALARL